MTNDNGQKKAATFEGSRLSVSGGFSGTIFIDSETLARPADPLPATNSRDR